jgi:hypothetical protein
MAAIVPGPRHARQERSRGGNSVSVNLASLLRLPRMDRCFWKRFSQSHCEFAVDEQRRPNDDLVHLEVA